MTRGTPGSQRLGLAGLALRQESRGLARMHLVGREQVERRQQVDVIPAANRRSR